jgi:hypothetical protein
MITDFEETTGTMGDDALFEGDYCSVDDVINKVLIFTGVTQRETENGLRTLIAVEDGANWHSAFFTESKSLKKVVHDPERVWPFRAIIKVVKMKDFTGFKFCSPNSEVTQEDVSNFQFYQRNKYRRK